MKVEAEPIMEVGLIKGVTLRFKVIGKVIVIAPLKLLHRNMSRISMLRHVCLYSGGPREKHTLQYIFYFRILVLVAGLAMGECKCSGLNCETLSSVHVFSLDNPILE